MASLPREETRFSVVNGDVASVDADLLLLKHAGGFYGADEKIAGQLVDQGACKLNDLSLAPGHHLIVDSPPALSPDRVLFLGTEPLHGFGYGEMWHFGRLAIQLLANLRPRVRRLATTIHGVGFGLDAIEALEHLIGGFRAGLRATDAPPISEIVFVERSERLSQLLAAALRDLNYGDKARASRLLDRATESDVRGVNTVPEGRMDMNSRAMPRKRHVFVAMPFSDDFEDVYQYGIYEPVRDCGLICEKTNQTHFTGDILQRIREQIETADYLVADLTGGRPNVYLEVGYAWGKGVPVIIIAREGEELHFDVASHKCIYYKNIRRLAKDLEKLLRGLIDEK